MKFELQPLPYDYNALEPIIDEQTMHLHHEKHHQAYIDKLNEALQGHDDLASMDIKELLANLDKVPEDIRTKVRNNGGGHANHTFFWKIMRPTTENNSPVGKVAEAINSQFGDFKTFQEEFANAAVGRFGSGWVWLTVNNGTLEITDTPNQDTPLMEGKKAILGLDVWEHAYYLKYQNRRAEYVQEWWKVVNWPKVDSYFSLSA
jgi:superoxide dismutase, Fe-Mn family